LTLESASTADFKAQILLTANDAKYAKAKPVLTPLSYCPTNGTI
jgi:hypothetical protein